MRILYHHRTQNNGVEGVHIAEIAKALTELGHQVDILSPAGLERFSEETISKLKKMHSFISRFMPEFGFELLEIFYNFAAGKKLARALNEKHYDLIYERYAIFNWSGVKIAQRFNTPIILEINYTSFTPLYRKRSAVLKPLAHRLDKKIFNAADGLVAVSTFLKKHLIDLGIQENKIIVLTNAADPQKFNPEIINGEEVRLKFNLTGKKVIGFIGGFYPWHGLEMLIDSFAEIKKEAKDAALLLIGDGPVKAKVEAKAKDLGIWEDVHFVARVRHDELPKYIAAFDVAVMPDSNEYGSPMKIYEYMAMGKPVVAPRLGPLEDGIGDGREGLLFNQHDKNAMAIALKTLLLNSNLMKGITVQARKNILSNHTWKKNAEIILRFYQRISAGSVK